MVIARVGIILSFIFVTASIAETLSDENDIEVNDTSTITIFSTASGYKIFPNIGVAYKYHEHFVTWNEARKACIADGSNLAVIDTFEKYEYIFNMINLVYQIPGPHVGIHRFFDNSEWVSATTGIPIKEIPFAPFSSMDDSARRCLAMWNDRSGLGADICSLKRTYVCEIPYPTSNSGISTLPDLDALTTSLNKVAKELAAFTPMLLPTIRHTPVDQTD